MIDAVSDYQRMNLLMRDQGALAMQSAIVYRRAGDIATADEITARYLSMWWAVQRERKRKARQLPSNEG